MDIQHSLDHPSLKDRVVIVTGAGRGFGLLISEALLRAGARVAVTASRHPDEVDALVAWSKANIGPDRCVGVVADVTKWEDCARTAQATLAAFGRIDVLINNAGRGTSEYPATTGPGRIPFYEIPVEAFRTVIDTNLTGVFNMTRAVVPHMVAQGHGKVFSISTSLTTMSSPGLSPYGASKAGLEMTHRIWAQELAGTGVDVNILLPGGPSDTPFIPESMFPGEIGKRAVPGGVLLPGDVIVPPSMWLCSDATNGVTGERIIARFWDKAVAPAEAFAKCVQPRNDLPGIM